MMALVIAACGSTAPTKEASEPDPTVVREAAGLWALGRIEQRVGAAPIVYVPHDGDAASGVRAVPGRLDPPAVLPAPPAQPQAAEGAAVRAGLSGVQRFLNGYRAAGGPPEYEQHMIDVVIPCEYGWEPWTGGNGYLSRAQFAPGSWASAGGGDPTDDYTVGRNVANWLRAITEPGGSGGWPYCWWAS